MHYLTLPIVKSLSKIKGDLDSQKMSTLRFLMVGKMIIDKIIELLRDVQYRALLKLHC